MVGTPTQTSAGGELVTDQLAPPGSQVPIVFNLPPTFGSGVYQKVTVGGRPVQVAFDNVGDIA